MESGRKIEAIKLYREQSGRGLKEAKDAVEAFTAGQPLLRGSPNALGLPPESLEGRILALMQAQRKIEAVKLFREQTGSGLKQAKDAVEALAAAHGVSPQQSGCATMLLLMLFVSTIIGLWSVLR
jgi:ribosomal protein L7/L12